MSLRLIRIGFHPEQGLVPALFVPQALRRSALAVTKTKTRILHLSVFLSVVVIVFADRSLHFIDKLSKHIVKSYQHR